MSCFEPYCTCQHPTGHLIHFKILSRGLAYDELRKCYLSLHEEREAWPEKEKAALRFRMELSLSPLEPNKTERISQRLLCARVYAEFNSSLAKTYLSEHSEFLHVQDPEAMPHHSPSELPSLNKLVLREWNEVREGLANMA